MRDSMILRSPRWVSMFHQGFFSRRWSARKVSGGKHRQSEGLGIVPKLM